jgi:hypothetical protein
VVLPAPRKPERTVTGSFFIDNPSLMEMVVSLMDAVRP